MRRIAVVSKDDRPLMPAKESRANRWVKGGKAIRKWSKLGFWYVQLTYDPEDPKYQAVGLFEDPGSMFGGI